jgi:hypothetical protein
MRPNIRRSMTARAAGLFLVLISPVGANAQAPTSNRSVSSFVSLGAGLARPAATTFGSAAVKTDGDWPDVTSPPLFVHAVQAEYRIKNGPALDMGGGVLIRQRLGIGMAVSRYADQRTADVIVTVDHPGVHPILNAKKTSGPMERSEIGLHIQLGYVVPVAERFHFMLFAGPSHFSVKQDVVANVAALELGDRFGYSLDVSRLTSERANASGWGANVGTDATVFLSDSVGVGALVRYARARVSLPNPMLSAVRQRTVTDDVDAGGLHVSAGLRLRF